VEFPVFAARIDPGGQIAEEGIVELTAGESAVQHFGIDADGDGAKFGLMESADKFAGVALPDGKESAHLDASEIPFPVGAEILEEDVTESYGADSGFVLYAQRFFHARFVNGVDALRRDAHLVQG